MLPPPRQGARVSLQAIVLFGGKTGDGQLIDSVAPAWFEILRILRSNPDEIFKIPSRQLEELIAGAYERMGFEVILTPRSGDGGRDVIAEKKGWFSVRILDQVKAY